MDADLKRLLKELGHKETDNRDRAYKEIAARLAADPQALNVLLPVMERELTRVRRLIYLVWSCVVVYIVFILLDAIHHRWGRVVRDCGRICMFYLALAMPMSKSPRLKSLLSIVSNLDDKRLVGPLLQAQRYHEVRSAIQTALLHLLPQLQHTDAFLLKDAERTLLYQSLNSTNPEYVLTVLKALEQVGDSKALPYVEKLVYPADKQDKQNKRNEAVVQAAQECLVFLQQRIERQQISQSLLRPSDKATAVPDTLLRSASATQDTEPAQLLRAGTNLLES